MEKTEGRDGVHKEKRMRMMNTCTSVVMFTKNAPYLHTPYLLVKSTFKSEGGDESKFDPDCGHPLVVTKTPRPPMAAIFRPYIKNKQTQSRQKKKRKQAANRNRL